MPEALKLVKADLGPRAVILNTRTLKKSSTLGILGKGQVEVTAAVDADRPAAARKQQARDKEKTEAETPPVAARKKPAEPPGTGRPAAEHSAPRRSTPRQTEAADSGWANRISQQLEDLQAALRTTTSRSASSLVLPGALEALSRQMEEVGLERALAEELLNDILLDPGQAGLKKLEPLQERAAQKLSKRFQPVAPTRLAKGVRAVVALVGPAGAGKTTTAARIAAHFAEQNARAAFVAADTDRVGGLEQLRAYAGILGIPADFVQNPDEMGETIRSRRNVDLIIIDTAGVSPIATDQMKQLGDLLKEAAPSETHLVLGASTGIRQMFDTVQAYKKIGADRLLLTKLDETGRLGAACTLAATAGHPLSYTTNGRDVPGNLQPADPEALCRNLFFGRPNGAA